MVKNVTSEPCYHRNNSGLILSSFSSTGLLKLLQLNDIRKLETVRQKRHVFYLRVKQNLESTPCASSVWLNVGWRVSIQIHWNMKSSDVSGEEQREFILVSWVCAAGWCRSSSLWWRYDPKCSSIHSQLPSPQVPDGSRGGKCREEESGGYLFFYSIWNTVCAMLIKVPHSKYHKAFWPCTPSLLCSVPTVSHVAFPVLQQLQHNHIFISLVIGVNERKWIRDKQCLVRSVYVPLWFL